MNDQSIISLFTEWMTDNNYKKTGVDSKGNYLWCPDGIRGHIAKTTEELFDGYKRQFHPTSAAAPQQTDDYQKQYSESLEWLVMVAGALRELVALKKIKDEQGKTPDYEDRQPKAWYLAFQAIELLDKDGGYFNKLPQHPQQQAGREASDKALKKILWDAGVNLSILESVTTAVKQYYTTSAPSSVSNPVAFAEWATEEGYRWLPVSKVWIDERTAKYKTYTSRDLYALFTSQHGEQEKSQDELWDEISEMVKDKWTLKGIKDHLKQHYHITPKNKQ